jgi:hypothetical protein
MMTPQTRNKWDEWMEDLDALAADLKGLSSVGRVQTDLLIRIRRAADEVASEDEAHFEQDAKRYHEVNGNSDMRIDPATRNAQNDVEEPGTATYRGNDSTSQIPPPGPPVAARHRARNDSERKLKLSS